MLNYYIELDYLFYYFLISTLQLMFKLKIKNGHNVNIAGNPDKKFLPTRHHSSVSLSPENFRYIKPKLLVKENDSIQLGDPVFFDKLNPEIKWPAIASGKISKIVYLSLIHI